MKASVIVCTYNRSALLKRTLVALAKQTMPPQDFEIIIVDDGSQDDTAEVCRSMKTHCTNIIYLRQEKNSGLAAAGNRGIATATAPFLLFTDDDCIPDPRWVEKMCEVLALHPIVAGAMISPEAEYFKLCHNIAQFYPFLPGQKLQKVDFIAGANMGFQAQVMAELGPFSTATVIPDMEYVLRARQKGYTITYAAAALITHDPQRLRLRTIFRYAAGHAVHTIALRLQYRQLLHTPFVLLSPFLLRLVSPLIALRATIYIYLVNHHLLKYWRTIPIVYLLKVVWCWGAARGLACLKKNRIDSQGNDVGFVDTGNFSQTKTVHKLA